MGFRVFIQSTEAKFSASHFLKDPPQCTRLHGHNYYVSVEISHTLDDNYFVVDFTDLKENLLSIVKPLDHYVLIPSETTEFEIRENKESVEVLTTKKKYIFPREDVFFLPLPATTSELLAKYIHDKLKDIYPTKTIRVEVEESKNTKAIFEDL
ncbi:MAG: 6-pyruvoyl tetrahydropterin synthase family protein [Promethearchaeota archaeon]